MGTHTVGPAAGRPRPVQGGATPARARSRPFQARTAPIPRTGRAIGVAAVVLGLVYGLYVAVVDRQGAPLTGGNALLGAIAGVVFAVLFVAVAKGLQTLTPGIHALGFGVLIAGAMGFLASCGGGSVLSSATLGLVVGAGLGIASYYAFYSRSK